MADAKEAYSEAVKNKMDAAANDAVIAEQIQKGFERKQLYGSGWDTVDINDVVANVAPGAKPIIIGGKIIYHNPGEMRAVVADPSGYLRVQDLSKKTNKRQYLDQYGRDAHNIKDSNGKLRGRSKDEFQRATHFIIKKRKKG